MNTLEELAKSIRDEMEKQKKKAVGIVARHLNTNNAYLITGIKSLDAYSEAFFVLNLNSGEKETMGFRECLLRLSLIPQRELTSEEAHTLVNYEQKTGFKSKDSLGEELYLK